LSKIKTLKINKTSKNNLQFQKYEPQKTKIITLKKRGYLRLWRSDYKPQCLCIEM
jgi:hypothetical protein